MFSTRPGATGRTESPVIKRALWNLSESDRTLGESSPVIGEKRVRLVVQRRVGDRTRPRRVRSLDLGASGQEYARVGASRWLAMVFFERLVHVVHKEQPDSTICASGHCSSKSGQYEKCPVKGVTAILALGAINGVCVQPWQMLGTLGT